ncbi:MAG: sugar ABC transporter permease [Alphaproteobacteria bacterium]|nr:sugar ABC transporter permease [Alphaproteobacteria bacterium]
MAAAADRRAPGSSAPARGWARERRRALRSGLLPALGVLGLVTLAPAVWLIVTSLTPLTPADPASFDFSEPWQSYQQAFTSPEFIRSVWVQIQLSLVTVVSQLLLGLGLALLLYKPSRILETIRTGFLVPMVLPPIVVAVIWKVVYTPAISPLHRLAAAAGVPFHSLITNSGTALWAIAVADTWEWFPFTMLMTLAALQMVPKEPQEAARIDGAGPIQLFWHVRLPYIQTTLVVATLFRTIDSIKAFPLIYLLTDGGPGGATQVTNYYAFVETFNFAYWGYGSAIATLLVAGVLVLSLVINRAGGGMAMDE